MEGFGWFTYETVKRIVLAHPEHEFVFFFDRPYDAKFIFANNVTGVVLKPQARRPLLFKIWFNYSLKKAFKKHQIDLFFSPDGYLSLSSELPQIGVIHDLNFEHYPEDLPGWALRYLKKYFPKFAKKAKHIITVSEYSRQDIINTYNIDPNKITVAHNGASELFKPLKEFSKVAVQQQYAKGNSYFVFVGALHARKNVQRLFKAYDIFKSNSNSTTQLVIVGEKLWRDSSLEKTYQQLQFKNEIHFTGHLPMDELVKVVGAAKAMIFPSYFEGFGIPLVEAMQSGVPVVCGDRTALPEVVQNAGLLVDPFDDRSIADGMTIVDTEDEFRAKMIEKGLERAEQFSWDFTADKIWSVLEREMESLKK